MPSSHVIANIAAAIVGGGYLLLAIGATVNGHPKLIRWLGSAFTIYIIFKIAPVVDGRENFISSSSFIKYFFSIPVVLFVIYSPIYFYRKRITLLRAARLIAIAPMTWYLSSICVIVYILFFSDIGKKYLTISLFTLLISNMVVFSQLLAFINKRIITFRQPGLEDFKSDNNYLAFVLTLSKFVLIIAVYGRIYSGEWMNYGSCKPIPLRSALYFSMVTWTTLGYGDIVPCGAWQRFFVMLESFSGYVYGSLLVAAVIEIFRGKQ